MGPLGMKFQCTERGMEQRRQRSPSCSDSMKTEVNAPPAGPAEDLLRPIRSDLLADWTWNCAWTLPTSALVWSERHPVMATTSPTASPTFPASSVEKPASFEPLEAWCCFHNPQSSRPILAASSSSPSGFPERMDCKSCSQSFERAMDTAFPAKACCRLACVPVKR